ncbi:hypothetical protein D030_4906A, partial [Vibrio parahaemolyticus AQ3810]
MNRVY